MTKSKFYLTELGVIAFFFLNAFALSLGLFVNHFLGVTVAIAITACDYFLVNKIKQYKFSSFQIIVSYIYSLLVSCAFVLSKQAHYVHMRGNIHQNYVNMNKLTLINGIVLSVLIMPLILWLVDFTGTKTIKNGESRQTIKHFFIYWGTIFVLWIPYLLVFYPGGVVGDAACTLEESLRPGIPTSNHWVVAYILVLRLFLNIGKLFSSDINTGIYIFAVFESIVYSAVCATVAYRIGKLNIHRAFVWGVVLMYALSGYFASYSMSLYKDSLFSAGIVLEVLVLWDVIRKSKVSAGDIVKLSALWLFTCFWRNNGLYVLVLLLACIAFYLKKQGIKLIVAGILVAAITLTITGPVYKSLGIASDSTSESLAIPLQQMAATVNTSDDISYEDREVLYSIIHKRLWLRLYAPCLSDSLKFEMDKNYLDNHAGEFLKIWAKYLPSNFETYVKAYLMETLGYWQIESKIGWPYDYYTGVQDLFDRGYEERNLIREATGINIKPILEDHMMFISPGTMVWLTLLAVTLLIAQKGDSKRLLVMSPLVISWLIILVAAPIAYSYRYIHMLPMALPVMVALLFEHGKLNEVKECKPNKWLMYAATAFLCLVAAICIWQNLKYGILI